MEDVMNPRLTDRLYALLKRDDLTKALVQLDSGMKDVVKYLLPKLLEGPIFHLKYCFDIMEVCFVLSSLTATYVLWDYVRIVHVLNCMYYESF